MARRQRECYLCGESYKYCGSCLQDRVKPSWMAEFHSEDCMRIFDICTRFNMKLMSKSEAQEELNACDLSNRENFKPYVQHDLEVIFEEEVVDEEVVSETTTRSILDKKSHEVVKRK